MKRMRVLPKTPFATGLLAFLGRLVRRCFGGAAKERGGKPEDLAAPGAASASTATCASASAGCFHYREGSMEITVHVVSEPVSLPVRAPLR
jgi:hypothetical protein